MTSGIDKKGQRISVRRIRSADISRRKQRMLLEIRWQTSYSTNSKFNV